MTAPDALRSLFENDDAPTRVVVLRAAAERDLGVDSLSQDQFTEWFDAQGDRILASALRKRHQPSGLEEVVLDVGDLLPPEGTDFDEDARVVALGVAVDDAHPLFTGTLGAALDYVLTHPAEWRENVCIWTENTVYGAAQVEALAAERTTE